MYVRVHTTVCTCSVPEFEASQYPVTNGEFLEFVESGGYQNRDLWSEEGNYVFLLHISTTCMCIILFLHYIRMSTY